jgi:hypothetical protein
MKTIERVIAFATLALIVTVSSSTVFAQTDRQTVVNIPFHFTVSDRAMPAGEYLIRRNRKDTDTVWVIQHKETGKAVMMLTRTVQGNENHDDARFVFRKYDDVYILSQFWTAGNSSGREIQVTDRERELSKALAKAPQVHVLIDRGGR